MADNYQHTQAFSGTITASGNSGYLPNLSQNGEVVALVNSGTVTGTTPSLTVTVYGALTSGGPLEQLVAFTAITSTQANVVRQALTEVISPFVYVAWVVSGTTPSFAGASIDLLFD
jgi:hypothetical protein